MILGENYFKKNLIFKQYNPRNFYMYVYFKCVLFIFISMMVEMVFFFLFFYFRDKYFFKNMKYLAIISHPLLVDAIKLLAIEI